MAHSVVAPLLAHAVATPVVTIVACSNPVGLALAVAIAAGATVAAGVVAYKEINNAIKEAPHPEELHENKKLFDTLAYPRITWQMAREERSKSISHDSPLDQCEANGVNRSAGNRSAYNQNKDPILSGTTLVVSLLTVQDSEQIVWMLSKNVLRIQTHTTLYDTWRYTCYVPQRSEYSATRRALLN